MVLTWRNVDAPNLGTAVDASRVAANQFAGAASGLSDAIGAFGREQTRQADAAAQLAALRFQNPNDYRNALVDGSLFNGINTSRISADGAAALGSRVGQLINQATNQQELDKGAYNFGRQQKLNAATDAAGPAVAELLGAAQRGDRVSLQNAYAQNQGVLGALTPDQQAQIASNNQGLVRGDLGNQRTGFDNAVAYRQDNDNQAAAAAFNELSRTSLTADDMRAGIARLAPNLSPGAMQALLNRANQMFPGTIGPIGTAQAGGALFAGAPSSSGVALGGAGAGGARGNAFDTVIGNGAFGTPQQPLTSMSMGDAINFGKNTLIPNTRNNASLGLAGTDKGSSAMGAFQITAGTMENYGPKVFGADWKNTQMTPENQDKLAKAIFDDNKGGNLKSTWASLPNATPGAYKNVPWEQMRNVIAGGEVGQSLPEIRANQRDLGTAANAAGALMQSRLSQNQAQGVSPDLTTTLPSTASNVEAAQELRKTVLQNVPEGVIVGQLNRIMRDGNVNAATAAAVLARNIDQADDSYNNSSWRPNAIGFRRAARNLGQFFSGDWTSQEHTSNLAGGKRFNMEGIKADIAGLKSGDTIVQTLDNQGIKDQQAAVQGARDAFNQASAQLAEATRRAQFEPALRDRLPTYQANLQAAQQALALALAQTQQNPAMLPINFQPNKK